MGSQIFKNLPLLGQSGGDYELLHQDLEGNLKFYEHISSRKQIVIRDIFIDKKYSMESMKQILSNRQEILKHHHLFQLLGTETSIHPSNCNTMEKIVVISEYSQRNLQDETEERSLQRRKYTEEELWTILASCILAFSHLEKNNIRHECLKSSEVFISSDGIIKIKDPITTGTLPNLEVLMRDRNSPHLYISPELCGSLAMVQPNHTYDPHKSDVFTLGVIILEAGLLQYQDSCYLSDSTAIDWGRLEANWNRFRSSYSTQLADILMDCMLDQNPKTRSGWSELEEHIKMFDEEEKKHTVCYHEIKRNNISDKENSFRQEQMERERERNQLKDRSKMNVKHKPTRDTVNHGIPLSISPNLSPESINRRANYHHPTHISNIVLVHKSSSNSPTLHPFKLISRKNYIIRKPVLSGPSLIRVQNSTKRRILQKSPKYQLKETLKFQSRQIVSPASKKQSRLNRTLEFGEARVFNRTKQVR